MKTLKKKHYFIPVVACAVVIASMAYYYTFTPFLRSADAEMLYIDSDDTADSVYAKLEPMSSAHAMTGLRTLLRHSRYETELHTGRYLLSAGMKTVQVYRMLKNGQQSPMMLTIPESRTMQQLASALSRRLMADSASIADALCSPETCARLGYDTCTVACMLVPNTYEVYWNTEVPRLLERLKKEHDRFWNDRRRQMAADIGLTPDEVCILASIVDEETANNAEKPAIAGMYLNRLRTGMPLQADPTVKYALKDFGLRRILQKHTDTDSPYNTYKHAGLPPGPIKIASIKGIDAVLGAEHHNYLYMCAKEDLSGTHRFASTYKEHQQNARRYQQALNKMGIH